MENELLKIKDEALEKIEACSSLKELIFDRFDKTVETAESMPMHDSSLRAAIVF